MVGSGWWWGQINTCVGPKRSKRILQIRVYWSKNTEDRRPKTDFCFPIEIKYDYKYELKRKEKKKKSGKVGIEKETEGEEK